MMRLVIALGGNALLQRGEKQEASNLLKNVEKAARVIVELAKDYTIILCHGNGPQVGLLALQAEAYKEVKPYTLDVLGAESQGMIGYLLQQAISNQMSNQLAPTLLTRVTVDPEDPAFDQPTKPIGPFYTKDIADQYVRERGWQFITEKELYRRVVPSPEPKEVIELPVIKKLAEAYNIVICGGGGGIPVMKTANDILGGVEAVIDKDLTAAKIAIACEVDAFLILTDINAVYADWNKPQAREIRSTTPAELSQYAFEKGSMGPKVKAACQFVETTHKKAIIASLQEARIALTGDAGTTISINFITPQAY